MKLILMFAVVLSCAHQRTVQENVEGIEEAGKEIEGKYVYANPSQEDEEVVADFVDSTYSLSLMGDLDEAFSFIGLLKEIEQNRLRVIGLSGQGTAALVSGLYAKYGKANMVEWILFKYLDKFFPFQKSFKKEYIETVKKLIKREFKGVGKSKFKLRFKSPSVLTTYQFILNEFEKESIKDKHYYSDSACVYESALYPKYINLCFFGSQKNGFKHDDIDRKSFSLKWYKMENLPLIDIIESKRRLFSQSLRDL